VELLQHQDSHIATSTLDVLQNWKLRDLEIIPCGPEVNPTDVEDAVASLVPSLDFQ
jgi:hypothetical protein